MKKLITISLLLAAWLWLCAYPSNAASAILQSRTGTGTAAASTLAYSSNVTAGNTLMVFAGDQAAGTQTSVTDTLGNTFTQKGGAGQAVASANNGSMWIAQNVTGGADTVTINDSSTVGVTRNIIITEISGVLASSFDVVAASYATGAASAPTSNATASTAQANELVVGVCVTSGGAVTAGSGFSGLLNVGPLFLEVKNVSATGTQAATFTNSVNWAASTITFKDSASGAGTHLLPITGAGS